MANPQIENGYTKIANELLEVIYRTKFNATQLKIILLIIRYTFGFNRKECELSLSFISSGIGVTKRYVSSELSKLIDMNVIKVIKEHSDTSSRILSLNKNYDEWSMGRTVIQQVKNCSTDEEQSNTTGEELFNTTVEEIFHQEIKNINKNINKNSSISGTIKQQMNNSSAHDNKKTEFKELARLYQICIGQPNGLTADWINSILEQYGFEWCKNAMLEAEKRGKRSKKYVEGILQNWKRNGGMKLEKEKQTVKPIKTRFHNFEQRTSKYTPEELEAIVRRNFEEKMKKKLE